MCLQKNIHIFCTNSRFYLLGKNSLLPWEAKNVWAACLFLRRLISPFHCRVFSRVHTWGLGWQQPASAHKWLEVWHQKQSFHELRNIPVLTKLKHSVSLNFSALINPIEPMVVQRTRQNWCYQVMFVFILVLFHFSSFVISHQLKMVYLHQHLYTLEVLTLYKVSLRRHFSREHVWNVTVSLVKKNLVKSGCICLHLGFIPLIFIHVMNYNSLFASTFINLLSIL